MFCKKCGAQLDDDAQFCEKCGTVIKRIVPAAARSYDEAAVDQDEDVKESDTTTTDDKEPEQEVTAAGKSEDNSSSEQEVGKSKDNDGSEHAAGKKQKKPLIIAAIITAVVIIAVLCFFLKPSGEVTVADPVAQANFNNYGKMTFDESNLYFVGKSDSKDEKTYVYATSYSGTDKRIISENDEISMIRMVGDKILYYARGDSNSTIGIMDKDGANNKVIIETEKSVSDFDITASKLYYLAESDLHRCTIGGEDDEIVLKDVDNFIISGKLYYTSKNSIYVYDLVKTESMKVCEANARELLLKDNIIYFVDDSGICSVSADGSGEKTTLVLDRQVGQYTIAEDTVFYVKKFTEDEVEALANYLNTGNDSSTLMLYQVALTGTGFIHSCPISGGEAEMLDTDPAVVFYLYSYPGGMYSSMGPLFDTFDTLTIKQ